jgi:stearoyl-CoA desaturase (Delta-9 desaturase)
MQIKQPSKNIGRADGFNKKTGIFIITYHIILLFVWLLYFSYCTPSTSMIIASVILYVCTGLSITAGYHRYYAHTTYKTNPAVEAVILFFASMATQASAIRWSFEHRLHHAYVDTDRDPYSVNEGFWYAHVLWLFKKPTPIDPKVIPDLMKNRLVTFQHNYYLLCMLTTNIIAFLFVGWLLNDYLGAFVLAWWTRLFALHHSTWFINSLAHYWGARTFSKEQTAVDNYVISFLTFGEGYHNYHHTFANDYRNGIRWYHFDPTKWLIWVLHKVGLAHNLKRVDHYHIRERMVTCRKNETIEKIQESYAQSKEELTNYLSKKSEHMLLNLQRSRQLVEKYAKEKSSHVHNVELLKELRAEIKAVKKEIRTDWKACKAFSKSIMKGKEPLMH